MDMFKIIIEDPELAAEAAKGGPKLLDLCQKEVEIFDAYLRKYGQTPEGKLYLDGLSKFEQLAIRGYLYQKLRGHVEQSMSAGLTGLPTEPK